MATDYISREAAIMTAMNYNGTGNAEDASQDIAGALGDIPAADVREVVKGEWKGFTHSAYHGQDEWDEPIYRMVTVWYCSKCNRRTVIHENFCPNCGADMREENND